MKIVSSFGERIKLYREDNKYTLAEMARLTGVPAPTLNRYELGQRIPKVDSATLIAHKLQINPLWLFGYDVEDVPSTNNLPSLAIQIEQEYGKNAATALKLYAQLDETDQIRITERMTVLLEDEKYSSKAKNGASPA